MGEHMKRLVLLHVLDNQLEFIVGLNCDDVTPLENGGYMVRRGEREDTVPAHRVDVFTHIPRPGLTPASSALPKGVEPNDDAARPWRCKECQKPSKTVHGVKTHFAMVHQSG